ncbi:DUF5071 domain-containing protein [Mycena indigotica]|uniref:DUF5071 domain-containing protein n=1 Tax=Mycena indigotica TaxID=2126181 RepID=A0A8H6VU26_9AGAR|nr:DUF5071 domain-containing protein [Mycena indigotica]KAF7291946.1 DUF5071 domain-containing protein [Mycena indigotica]
MDMQVDLLSDEGLATLLPSLLMTNPHRHYNRLATRVAAASPDNPLTSAITTILTAPAEDVAAAKIQGALFGWAALLPCLPKLRLADFRPALRRLADRPSALERQHGLPIDARELIEYIDRREPWVPVSKSDYLGLRSLDAVTCAAEMAPFVKGLLEWLQDPNWPIAEGCAMHLARFPELCADPIRRVLERGDDAGWESQLLWFVSDNLAVRDCERMRAELERIVQRPTLAEEEEELGEVVLGILERMDYARD